MENSLRLKFGRILSQPPSNEEVVISGISGAFPSADTIEEFEKNLQNKVNMTTRKATEHGVIGVGLFKDKTKFDSGSFAMHLNQSRSLHPIGKLLLEKCYECIFDAGLNPSDLEGTRTGVYMGFCFSEVFLNDVLGYMRSALVNRISAHLKVQGPSVVLDTACSSTGYALDTAYKAIRMGQLDYAIICGAHFLTENITMQFKRLGMLSSDGYSKPFDAKGTGYVRSEGAVAILLQKSANSKRIYAKCIHTKSNCNGFQEQGIMHPSFDAQFQLLDEIYMESGVKLSQVDYVEAHGTGTIVGDPIEVDCLDKFFFPKRQSPILIGSVKSSIGHTEAVSILCSIAKVILAFESGKILPNINYNTPRENLHGIIEGRFKVVTESTPLPSEDSIVGINNSGFGGANAHAILQRFSKRKIHNELPEDLPRLVCVSGRTEEAVQVLLNDIEEKFDVEHIGLIHNIFRKPINNHMFRGYLIVSKNGSLKQSVSKVTLKKNSLIVIFGDLMEISIKFLIDLLALPLLSNFNNQLLQLLAKCKIDFKTINSESPSILKNLLFQLTVAELLKLLEIQYDGVFGYSFGHFACSYYKGSLGLKELVECIAIILKYGKRMGINGSPNVKIDSFMVFKKEIQEDFKKVLPQSVAKHFLEKLFNGPEEYRLHRKYTYVLEIGLSHHQNKSISFGGQLDLLGVLDILGRLFELGVQPQIQFLYPKVEFPVSRGTPMISSKIKWKHNRVWTTDCPLVKNALPKNVYVFEINVDIAIWTDLQGHLIDGRLLLPAICYLDLVWDVFSKLSNTRKANLKVTFENCKFLKACNVSKSLTLEVMIQNSSGNFEICEKDVVVMTGRVSIANKADSLLANSVRQSKEQKNDILLNTKDIYKELHLRGYNYKGKFKSLAEANASGTQGKIKWQGNWVTFIDNMLQMKILSYDTRSLYVPIKNKNSAEVELSVTVDPDTGIISSGGMTIEGLMASPISRKKTTAVPVLEKYQFVSNQDHIPMHESIRVFMQVFLENHSTELKISVVELNQEGYNPIGPVIREVLDDQPLVQSNIVLLTDQTLELEGVTVNIS